MLKFFYTHKIVVKIFKKIISYSKYVKNIFLHS